MTEIELLRDLEKAALGFVGDPHRYRAIATSNDEMDAVKAALAALSAYRAQPQEAEGETVEVWGYVHTDPRGMVNGSVFAKETDARHRAGRWGNTECGPIMGTVFSVRAPLPVIPTISASITGNIEP